MRPGSACPPRRPARAPRRGRRGERPPRCPAPAGACAGSGASRGRSALLSARTRAEACPGGALRLRAVRPKPRTSVARCSPASPVTPETRPVCTMLPGPAARLPSSRRWSSSRSVQPSSRPSEAGAAPRQARTRDEGGRDALLRIGGHQGRPRRAPAVVHARVGQRGVVDGVQPVAASVERLEADADDERVAARVGDVRLGDPVPAGGRGADLLEAQAALVGTRGHHVDVLGLAVGERAAVGQRGRWPGPCSRSKSAAATRAARSAPSASTGCSVSHSRQHSRSRGSRPRSSRSPWCSWSPPAQPKPPRTAT